MGMKPVLIFAGTTEGRLAADKLVRAGVPCTVCVATDYGEAMMEPKSGLTVHTGRLDKEQMVSLMRGESDGSGETGESGILGGSREKSCESAVFSAVVDATHPFATAASREIRTACEETGLPYLRLARETALPAETEGLAKTDGLAENDVPAVPDLIMTGSTEEAAEFLNQVSGRILLTTGSKELPLITSRIEDKERLFARVLPLADSLAQCEACGLKGRQVIAMQGPFDEALNVAMLSQIGASWLLTKQTGSIGGFEAKIEGARKAGAKVVVIRNPEIDDGNRLTMAEVMAKLEVLLGCNLSETGKPEAAGRQPEAADSQPEAADSQPAETGEMALVGIGVGRPDYLTGAVCEAIEKAEIIFGAPRILESLKPGSKRVSSSGSHRDPRGCAGENVPMIPVYQADKILAYLEEHPGYRRVVVAFSGDTGFYSGASSMMRAIRSAESRYDVRILCGISAPVYFASKIGEPWQDWTLLSAHGRGCNILGHVRRHSKCFFLASGRDSLKEIGRNLCRAEEEGRLKGITVTYGYQLSYPEESIGRVTPDALENLTDEGLYVLLIENPYAGGCPVVPGVADEAFIRAKVPMTKEEIRALSLCKLRLTSGAVIYDIGAGSGSVSVEAALLCPDGHVYAVEHKEEAVDLIGKNRDHFAVSNMTVIKASAPDGLDDLPAPTHAFIGGSSGNMREILETILKKNPAVRVVVNAVTLETLAEAQTVLAELGFVNTDFVQVQVSRAEVLGRYHLMKAQNPVFIISADGPGGTR